MTGPELISHSDSTNRTPQPVIDDETVAKAAVKKTGNDPQAAADQPASAPIPENVKPDAEATKEWQNRQPAQVTVQDVAAAKRHPEQVPPPGQGGPAEGPGS